MTFGLLLLAAQSLSAQTAHGKRDSLAGPSPAGAFWRSLAVPGWGQWYDGRRTKAFVYGGIVALSVGMAARNWDAAIGTTGPGSIFWSRDAWAYGRNNWLILAGFAYLLGAVDAYVDAHLQTFDVSPIAVRVVPTTGGGAVVTAVLPWQERE